MTQNFNSVQKIFDTLQLKKVNDIFEISKNYPNDVNFDNTFWNLSFDQKITILKYRNFFKKCHRVGIYLQDLLDISPFLTKKTILKINDDVTELLNKNKSLTKLTINAKKFALSDINFTLQLIEQKISINYFFSLSDDTQKLFRANLKKHPNFKIKGISKNKFKELSNEIKVYLIIFLELHEFYFKNEDVNIEHVDNYIKILKTINNID